MDRDDVTPAEEERLTRYLLGELSQLEQAEVEDACFADTSRFERLLAVEDELVDAYVRGELSPERTRALDERASRVAGLRRKIQVARALQQYAEANALSAERVPASMFWWRPAVWSVAALVILTVTLTMWWLRPGGRSGQTALERGEPQPAGETRQPGQRPPTPPPEPQKPVVIVAFTLTATSVRTPSESNTLPIPVSASLVRLRLEHDGEAYPRYRATIQTVDGRDVWQQQDVKPPQSAADAVVVDVPAARLPADDYILTLAGAARGAFEDVAAFSFRVRREER